MPGWPIHFSVVFCHFLSLGLFVFENPSTFISPLVLYFRSLFELCYFFNLCLRFLLFHLCMPACLALNLSRAQKLELFYSHI